MKLIKYGTEEFKKLHKNGEVLDGIIVLNGTLSIYPFNEKTLSYKIGNSNKKYKDIKPENYVGVITKGEEFIKFNENEYKFKIGNKEYVI